MHFAFHSLTMPANAFASRRDGIPSTQSALAWLRLYSSTRKLVVEVLPSSDRSHPRCVSGGVDIT